MRLLVYYKKIQLRNSQMEEMNRARYGRSSLEIPWLLWVMPSQHFHVFTLWESLWTLSFEVFMKALLHGYDWLNHWQVVISSTFSSSHFPGGEREVGLQVITFYHNVVFLSNQPPRCGYLGNFQKNQPININSGVAERSLLRRRHPFHIYWFGAISGTGNKRCPYDLYHWGNYKLIFMTDCRS